MAYVLNISEKQGWLTGKDWVWDIYVTDDNGNIVDITGWHLEYVVKPQGAKGSTPAVLTVNSDHCPIIDGETGWFQIQGSKEQTEGKDGNQTYAHECRRIDAGFEDAVFTGSVYLGQSITG